MPVTCGSSTASPELLPQAVSNDKKVTAAPNAERDGRKVGKGGRL
jgi:hypothetical protein